MKRGLVIITAVIGFLLLGLWALQLVDWQAHRKDLAAQISTATGAQVALDGRLSIRFLPYPLVEAEAASLTAPGLKIHAPALRLAVELWPLLRGQVILSKAVVRDAVIELSPADWRAKKPRAPEAATNVQLQKVMDNARVTLRFRDRDLELDKLYLDLFAPDWHGPYYAAGDMLWRDEFLEFSALLGVAAAGARPGQLKLSHPASGDSAQWQGAVVAAPFAWRGDWSPAPLRDADCGGASLAALVACLLTDEVR